MLNKFFIQGSLALAILSVFYALMAFLNAPLFFSLTIPILGVIVYLYSLSKKWSEVSIKEDTKIILLLSCLSISALLMALLARYNGDWDAQLIFNVSKEYLLRPSRLENLFNTDVSYFHPDYPLLVPSSAAYLTRFLPDWISSQTANLFLDLWFGLGTIALLTGAFVKDSKLFFLLIYASIGLNIYFLNNAIIHCADVPLSFFILAYFVVRQSTNVINTSTPFLLGSLLGAMIWTKNEGLFYVLTLILFDFKYNLNFLKEKWFYFGLIPFVLILVGFKILYQPSNDLFASGVIERFLDRAGDKNFYKVIAVETVEAIFKFFPMLIFWVIITFGAALLLGTKLNRRFWIFPLFFLGMVGIYGISPHDTQWHVENSISRLILQWYPSILYLLGLEIIAIRNHIKRTVLKKSF